MLDKYVFTSESVSEGHPDKVCDRISDAILDEFLTHDKEARVAVEALSTTNRVILAGETRTSSDKITNERINELVKDAIKYIGYNQDGFSWKTVEIFNYLHEQSQDIAVGVDSGNKKDEGAGDQGIMFGFACRETESLMPAPIYYSHRILENLTRARKNGDIKGILPDSKSQITIEYDHNKPLRATSIVLSTQHESSLSQQNVRDIVIPIIEESLPKGWMCSDEQIYVNPTGIFTIGGPDGDAGLTGRKIIVDTYGGAAPHGGGAFSGKDPTKVDRSAAYAARYIAKNIVAADLAEKCTIQFSYAIGVSKPISLFVNTHDTGKVSEAKLVNAINETFNLSPRAIRERLELNRPIYKKTSSYGHFGREPEADGSFSWEKLDLIEDLKSALT